MKKYLIILLLLIIVKLSPDLCRSDDREASDDLRKGEDRKNKYCGTRIEDANRPEWYKKFIISITEGKLSNPRIKNAVISEIQKLKKANISTDDSKPHHCFIKSGEEYFGVTIGSNYWVKLKDYKEIKNNVVKESIMKSIEEINRGDYKQYK